MKKLLIGLLLFIPLTWFASIDEIDFNLSNYQSFDENEGQVHLSALKVDLWTNTTRNLVFSIADKDFLIFANDISKVQIDNSDDKILSVKVEENNKVLKIELKEDITSNFEVSWVQVRTYDEEVRWAKIGFDYDNDWEIDKYSTNVIDLETNWKNDDSMKPLIVSDVEYNLTKNRKGTYDLVLTWTRSPDLDIYGSLVKVNKNNSYWNIKEELVLKTLEQKFEYLEMNLEKDTFRFEIYSKDLYYLNTDPFTITFDKDNLEEDETCEDKTIFATNNDTQECSEFTNTCDVTTDYTVVDKCEDEEEEIIEIEDEEEVIEVEETAKLEVKFSEKNSKVLNKFMSIIDSYISRKIKDDFEIERSNKIMTIRNNIWVELLNYDNKTTRDEKVEVVNRLKILIINLKNS